MPVNSIVDLSHHNQHVNLAQARAGGLAAVFHKASQGLSYKDPLYDQHKQDAESAGLLWGAYHFADGSDGVAQADFFLNAAQCKDGELLVLDFEANTAGPSMSLGEARAFVTHIKQVTGKWPGFYCGHYFKELVGTVVDPVIGNCWLWLAQYGPTAIVPATWSTWTFWQYTDGAGGPPPHEVPGIGLCDRDQFCGTDAELTQFWNNGGQLSMAAGGSSS